MGDYIKWTLKIMVLTIGAWYGFSKLIYFDVSYLSEPAVKGYEKFLDTVEAMASYSDLKTVIHPSYLQGFRKEYAQVSEIKVWHALSAMEYLEYDEIDSNMVEFVYVGSLDMLINAAPPEERKNREGLVICKVRMINSNEQWLLHNQECYELPEKNETESRQEHNYRAQGLKKYYRIRESRK